MNDHDNKSPKVDLTFLKDNTGNNNEFLKEMISLLVVRIPDDLERLKKGQSENNGDEMSAAAHKMKPNLDMLGAAEMKDCALFIEEHAKNSHKKDDVLKKIQELDTGVTKLITALKEEESRL